LHEIEQFFTTFKRSEGDEEAKALVWSARGTRIVSRSVR